VILEPILVQPPAPDELEVSIFGPGFGESVVVHLGQGQWMVVDSCQTVGGREPVAAQYLSAIGVDLAKDVILLVATHWHDDHIRRISQLLSYAEAASFYASAALTAPEFLALLDREDLSDSKFTNGVQELQRVNTILVDRDQTIGKAGADRRIYQNDDGLVSGIWTLSPSDAEQARALTHFGTLLPKPGVGMSRVPAELPNDSSVVVYLETVAGPILLGADLEHLPEAGTRGWHAIVDSPNRPTERAVLYKVAHHGSITGECERVWDGLIVPFPQSVLTPWERGNSERHLPRASDKKRIRERSENAYLTSDKLRPQQARPRAVQKMISETTRSYREHRLILGHVQMRRANSGWVVRGSEPSVTL
jgi:hypothetical protein